MKLSPEQEDKILSAFEKYPGAKCIVKYSCGQWKVNFSTSNVEPIADGTWWECNTWHGGHGGANQPIHWHFVQTNVIDLSMLNDIPWKECKFDNPLAYCNSFMGL